MNKLFSTLFAVVFATSMLAQSGLTCNDPIPVDKSYVGKVEAGTELWYTAWSYDLPMHVYFSPTSSNSQFGPEVQIDFTCEEGVYEDKKLDSVINKLSAMEITLPVEFMCDKVVRDGKVEWDLSIDERYRNYLTEWGLTYNVQAFVKVYFPEAGEIRLTPDQSFQSCMESGRYVKLGDTIDIAANDAETILILPYSEWQNDSIRFVWVGDKSARVWVAEDECQFNPVLTSIYVKATYDIDKDTPKKLYSDDIKFAIDNWIGAGLYYAKVLSDGPGKLVVERIPLGDVQGGATLLKHNTPVQLQANDKRVFCFPVGWKSTEFLANTEFLMGMHVSNTPEFEIGDANVLSVYPFSKNGANRLLQISEGDIAALAASATDDYLYVRFSCNSATTLTPSLWNVSSCVAKTILISSGEVIENPSDKTIYRMDYDDWANDDFTISWDQRGILSVYVSSYCNFTTTDPNRLGVISVPAKSTTTVSKETMGAWETYVDEGFIFMILKTSRKGNVIFTSTKPAEEDPALPSNPCVLGSTELKLNSVVNLNLSSVHTIYRINYAEWQAAGATLAWGGTSPLHTFLASTCTFPVAPHNRYVLDYEAVLPAGEKVMAADWLARMAQYVDEDGYLYIRFLTEFEGTLQVK